MKLMVKMRFICVICGLGVVLSPISIDNGVVCIMIKRSPPQFPINLHQLLLASLALPRSAAIFSSNLLPSSHNCETPEFELNVFSHSRLPPVFQPNSTSISGEKQTLIVTARSYWLPNSFQIGSIP